MDHLSLLLIFIFLSLFFALGSKYPPPLLHLIIAVFMVLRTQHMAAEGKFKKSKK